MKHHVLFIIKDVCESTALSKFLQSFSEEHRTVINHLKARGASQLCSFIECGGRVQLGVIVAPLTTNPTCINIMKCWYDSTFEDASSAIETISETLAQSSQNVNDNVLFKHADSASLVMDHLLDSIPHPASAKLHIVIDEDLFAYWPLSETCDLFCGSLLRALLWNAALLYPLTGENGRFPLDQWVSCLDSTAVVAPQDKVLFSTRIDGKSVHFALDVIDGDLVETENEAKVCCSGSNVVSWDQEMEVVRSVSLQSIPPHYFLPSLHLYATDTDYLARFGLNETEGLLVRVNGLEGAAPEISDCQRSTERWRLAVSESNLKAPEMGWTPSFAAFFVLTADGSVLPLVRSVNLDFLSQFAQYHPVPLPNCQSLPMFEQYTDAVPQDCYSYLGDPSEWPQRQFLLEEVREAPVTSASNVLLMSAPVIVSLFDLATGRAIETSDPLDDIPLKTMTLRPTISVEEAQKTNFPDILQHVSHDVYYNRSLEDEIWERTLNRWKNAVLRHPTATSLDEKATLVPIVRKLAKPTTRQSPRKNLFEASPRNRRRSPRKLKSPKRDSSQILRRNPFRDILKEVSSSSLVGASSSQTSSSRITRSSSFFQTESSQDEPPKPKRARTNAVDNEKLKRKLREAVATALEDLGINLKHPMFATCGKKLFSICRTFAVDLIGTGRTSEIFLQIARSHAKQVVDFEMSLKNSA